MRFIVALVSTMAAVHGLVHTADVSAQGNPPRHATLPAVSPDGRRIAYLIDRDGKEDLYTADVDGRHEKPLTATGKEASRPVWTADGKEILMSRFADGTATLVAVPTAGGPERVVSRVPGRGPMLLGSRVLYSTGDWTTMQLATSALDGSDARRLSDGNGAIWMPAVSPDGRRVAFSRQAGRGELQVWTMNADGTGAAMLGPFDGRAQGPSWSPDGTRLAVFVASATAGKEQARLWIIDLATGQRSPAFADTAPHLDEIPVWFPDGKRLAFQSDRSGRFEIWTVEIGGSAPPRQITK